jgi:hypothetical protein
MKDTNGKLNTLKVGLKTISMTEQQTRKLLAAAKEGTGAAHAGHIFSEGDRVQVIKEGSQFGKSGVVANPDWNGRVQMIMVRGSIPITAAFNLNILDL